MEYKIPLSPQRSLPSFTQYFLFLAFVCRGTSSVVQRFVTISSNHWDCYLEFAHDHTQCYLVIVWFGVQQKTINILQSFQDGA